MSHDEDLDGEPVSLRPAHVRPRLRHARVPPAGLPGGLGVWSTVAVRATMAITATGRTKGAFPGNLCLETTDLLT